MHIFPCKRIKNSYENNLIFSFGILNYSNFSSTFISNFECDIPIANSLISLISKDFLLT